MLTNKQEEESYYAKKKSFTLQILEPITLAWNGNRRKRREFGRL